MNLRIHDIADNDVLAGAGQGVTMLIQLIKELGDADETRLAILDFGGIHVATGSYLRESVLGFRSHCRQRDPSVAILCANVDPIVLEELRNLLVVAGDALVACDTTTGNEPCSGYIVGALEDKQRTTLDAVLELGVADARALHERFQDSDKISVTGWNNRLAALADKGILVEERDGRTKRYRPVIKELRHGR